MFTSARRLRHGLAGLLLATVVITGCAQNSGPTGEDVAKQKAAAIFKAIEEKDFKKAASLYSKEFYRVTTPLRWQAHLEEVHDKFGDLENVNLHKVVINSVYSGTRVILKYKNHYSKHDAFETVAFDDQLNEKGMNVVAHKIDMVPED